MKKDVFRINICVCILVPYCFYILQLCYMWNSCNTNDKSFNKVCDSHQENVMKYSLGGDEEMGSRSHYFVDIKYLEF